MRVFRKAAGLAAIAAFTLAAQTQLNEFVRGDMILRPNAAFTAFEPVRLWTNNTVPYVIDPAIPNPSRITDGFAWYNANTPIHFQPRAGETNYVYLMRSTIGNGVCTSNVGMIGGEQFIHVEDACTTSSLIHEMGHTVGFLHEQSRPDRNPNVTILYENVDKTGYSDFHLNPAIIEQPAGPYDFASHMHYGSFSFSVNQQPTIQTVPAGIQLNPYPVLSPGDLDALFRLYGQPPAGTTIVTNPPGLSLTIDSQTVVTPQVVTWSPGSTHTVAASTATTSTARYLFARWTDGGAATHTITADPSVTFYSADFIQQVPLTVGVDSAGGGTVALSVSSPDNYFASQTPFTMTATPAPGYTFLKWSGGPSCPRANGASPTSFVLGATPINCVATFTTAQVTTIQTSPLNLPVTVDGFSYVQTPVNVVWTPGTTHTISTAAPASNPVSAVRYIFQGWSDSGAPSHTVTAGSSAATLTANYKTQYSLVPPVVNSGSGTFTISPASPDNFYDAGATLQIAANPSPGQQFVNWTGDLFGQPNPATLVMDSQKAFGAVFSPRPPVLTPLSAASFAGAPLAPGELIALFGNVGPTVTFNGVAAPILYNQAGQAGIVVPYEVAGQTSVAIQTASNTVMSTVDVSAPGIFTANARGLGQIAAANQDGTFNSAANPAAKGSIVTIYATGAGQLSPAGVDGAITSSPLPQLTQPVSVRIGGKPAQLQYAGPAPAQISGVTQINAVIPSDAPSGPGVSVYLVIGNNSSPLGPTLAIQ